MLLDWLLQIFKGVEEYVHPSWTGDVNDGFDVGLLKLDREPDSTIPAIDTHSTPLSSGDLLTVLGWGRTETQLTSDSLQMAENLQYMLPVLCEQELGDIFLEHMICAGLLNENACEGENQCEVQRNTPTSLCELS